jgi:hypothetical protein
MKKEVEEEEKNPEELHSKRWKLKVGSSWGDLQDSVKILTLARGNVY